MTGTPQAAPLIAVAGPTGSGKSELALRLAEEFGGEVVNCDSLQVYRMLDIGTAKLPVAERRGIPHHLLDVVDPDQVFTAGEYARAARPILKEIAARGNVPVVVGGTGFYLRALIDGLFAGPERNDLLRSRLAAREQRRPGWLHHLLQRFDPPSAERIAAADVQKLIRAMEVLLVTRRTLSSWFEERRDALEGFCVLKIGLDPPRTELYEHLDARCERMFRDGLIEEVQYVLKQGFSPGSKALEAHGYKQVLQLLEGKMALGEAVATAQRNTRRYAKRQWTWFRREAGMCWLKGFGSDPVVQREAEALVREFWIKCSPC